MIFDPRAVGAVWLTETNTDVAARCYPTPWKCPTTFVGPLGMAASFNKSSWHLKGKVLGTEMRAFHNLGWHRGEIGDKIGLTGFGPNINIARGEPACVFRATLLPLPFFFCAVASRTSDRSLILVVTVCQ